MQNVKVIDLFRNYIVAERRYSPLTVRNYMRDIEEFVEWGTATSGEFMLDEVTRDDIRGFLMWLSDCKREKGGKPTRQARLGAASINRKLSSLRSLYKYLRREEIVERDVFAGMGSLRTQQRLPKYVTEENMVVVVERVLQQLGSDDYIERRDAMMVLLFYSSGIRLAELVAIDVDHFSDDYRTLRVRGKGDKERQLPIVERVRQEIIRYTERLFAENICISQQKALFLSVNGERIARGEVQRSVARLLRGCGVQGKCSPHVLRHTFATHLLNDGADLREIQELMGHSSLKATQVYTHSNIAQLQSIYSAAHPRAGRVMKEG